MSLRKQKKPSVFEGSFEEGVFGLHVLKPGRATSWYIEIAEDPLKFPVFSGVFVCVCRVKMKNAHRCQKKDVNIGADGNVRCVFFE